MTLTEEQAAMRERSQQKTWKKKAAERRRDAVVLKALKRGGIDVARLVRARLAEL